MTWCVRSKVTAITQLLVKHVTFTIFSSSFSLNCISEKMQHLKVLNNGHPYIGFFFFILVSNALTSSLIDLGFSLQRNLLMIIMNTFISMEAYYDTVKQNSTEKGEIMHTQIQGSLLKTQGGFPQLKGSTCWKHIPSKYHPYMAASSKTHIHRFPCFWIPELA